MAAIDPSDAPASIHASTATPRFRYRWIVLAASAAILAGAIRDSTGDYATTFVAAGWIAIAAGIAAPLIRRPKLVPDPVAVAA